MRRLALLLSVALACPASAEAPDTALRPVMRPVPEAPARPMARPDTVAALTLAAAAPARPVARPVGDAAGAALVDVLTDTGVFLAAAVLPPLLQVDRGTRLASVELPPIAAMDVGTPLRVAAVPLLESRVSTRNIPINDRLRRVEGALARLMAPVGDGPALSEPVAAVLRLPPAPEWNGPIPMVRRAVAPLRPLPRPDLLGSLAPREATLRPGLRTEEFELRTAAALAPMIYTQQVPPALLPEISPLAVAEAVRPEMRAQDFEIVEASAQVAQPGAGPSRPLVQGSGLCGVVILSGSTLGSVPGPGDCGVSDAVEVTSVGGIRLSTGLTVDCTTATALATWVRDVANPAVGSAGGGLARIEVGGGYTCRGRNGQAGARLSEHAFGRAVDIMGFTLQDGTRLTVLNNWGNGILRAMHRGACGIFGTVLGPEANRYHRDHFHFDTARYRSGSYCE